MGKPRVRGQHNQVFVQDRNGTHILVGEITKMSVKELGELKKNRGLGEARITSNKTFEGYDLSFEGGLVDWNLASLLFKQDNAIYDGSRSPYFKVQQKIMYYGTDQFTVDTYPEVTFHGYNLDADSMDESTQKWEGFCGCLKVREDQSVATDPAATVGGIAEMISKTLSGSDNASQ